jgi:hypothetical protein
MGLQRRSAPALDLDARDLILHLLESIDRVRERQHALARQLKETLEYGTHVERWDAEPVNVVALCRAWSEFVSAGGVTADDWRAFCRGGKIATPPIKAKRHLRLISDRVRHTHSAIRS